MPENPSAKIGPGAVEIGGSVHGAVIITGRDNIVTIYYGGSVPEPPRALGANPYRGLDAFREADAEYFFGRKTQVARVWNMFSEVYATSELRLVTILGPSGSGKSSLAHAGLLPEFARSGLIPPDRGPARAMQSLRFAVFTPGTRPLDALAAALARIALPDEPVPVRKAEEFAEVLSKRIDGLEFIAGLLPDIDATPLIILIDQLEEIYSQCKDEGERGAFIATLLDAAKAPSRRVSVLATLRSDFLREIQRAPALSHAVAMHPHVVPVMDRNELRCVIAQPATKAGRPLDEVTIERLLTKVEGRVGALPLLEFALTRIWDGTQEGKNSPQVLDEIGGVEGALAGWAQARYDTLDDAEQVIAKRAFLRMIQLGGSAPDTRRRVRITDLVAKDETPEQIESVLRRFSDRGQRLITLSGELDGTQTAEVTHEALFKNWSTLSRWLDEGREDVLLHLRLKDDVAAWERDGRSPDFLWRAALLERLRDFHARAAIDMAKAESDFFQASEVLAAKELEAVRDRAEAERRATQAELERAKAEQKVELEKTKSEHRRSTLFKRAAAIAASLALAAAILGLWAWTARQDLQAQVLVEHGTQAERLAGQPDAQDEALQTAIKAAAYDVSRHNIPPPQIIAGLAAATSAAEGVLRLEHPDRVYYASFSPTGDRIVTAGGPVDRLARVLDARTGKLIRTLEGHTDEVRCAKFSPDGHKIITSSEDKTARVWDLDAASNAKPLVLDKVHPGRVSSASFSPDGTLIVTSSDAGAYLWRADGTLLFSLLGHKGFISTAVFSPDGSIVATSSNDHKIGLWSVSDGKLLKFLGEHGEVQDEVRSAAFSPDGKYVIAGGNDRLVRIWDIEAGIVRYAFAAHTNWVRDAEYSSDGTLILTSSEDGTARLWKAENRDLIREFKGRPGAIFSARFSPDDKRVVTASWDRSVRIFTLNADPSLRPPFPGSGAVRMAAFSPDGAQVALVSDDGSLRFYDVSSRKLTLLIEKAHDGPALALAYSADGSKVVTGGQDHKVKLWDARTGAPGCIFAHPARVLSVAFSPDGKWLVSGGGEKGEAHEARIWGTEPCGPRVGLTGSTPLALTGHESFLFSVAFSPDGKKIVTASEDHTTKIWDARTGILLQTLTGHAATVFSAAYSSDGKQIVTGGDDSTIKIWDAETAKVRSTLEGQSVSFPSAAFSPDGRWVLAASKKSRAQIWDIKTRHVIWNLLGHTGGVLFAAFSPAGDLVVTASEDGNAKLYSVRVEDLFARACQLLRDKREFDAVSEGLPRGVSRLDDDPPGSPIDGKGPTGLFFVRCSPVTRLAPQFGAALGARHSGGAGPGVSRSSLMLDVPASERLLGGAAKDYLAIYRRALHLSVSGVRARAR